MAKHDPEFGQRCLGPTHQNVVILSEEFKGETNDLMILPDARMSDEDHIALFWIHVESLVNNYSWVLVFFWGVLAQVAPRNRQAAACCRVIFCVSYNNGFSIACQPNAT